MNKVINNFLLFIWFFILDLLYSAFVITILDVIGFNVMALNNGLKSICLILIDISFMLILYLCYRKEINKEFFRYIKHFGKNFFFGFKFWVLGIILMVISNIIINTIHPSVAVNEEAVQNSLKALPVYTAFASCIFAPFVEEIIFRKCLRKVFSSDIIFIVASGLLFGIAHNLTTLFAGTDIYQLLYLIPYGLFGCIFAYIYVKSKTIFVPIGAHMMHNTILVIISLSSMGVI